MATVLCSPPAGRGTSVRPYSSLRARSINLPIVRLLARPALVRSALCARSIRFLHFTGYGHERGSTHNRSCLIGKWVVALTNTIDLMRFGWLVAMCRSVVPPELIPTAEKRSTPGFSSNTSTSLAASWCVNLPIGLVETTTTQIDNDQSIGFCSLATKGSQFRPEPSKPCRSTSGSPLPYSS